MGDTQVVHTGKVSPQPPPPPGPGRALTVHDAEAWPPVNSRTAFPNCQLSISCTMRPMPHQTCSSGLNTLTRSPEAKACYWYFNWNSFPKFSLGKSFPWSPRLLQSLTQHGLQGMQTTHVWNIHRDLPHGAGPDFIHRLQEIAQSDPHQARHLAVREVGLLLQDSPQGAQTCRGKSNTRFTFYPLSTDWAITTSNKPKHHAFQSISNVLCLCVCGRGRGVERKADECGGWRQNPKCLVWQGKDLKLIWNMNSQVVIHKCEIKLIKQHLQKRP